MSSDTEEWGKYGLPGKETVEIRDRVSTLIRRYCSEKSLNLQNDIDIGVGFKCLFIELYAPLSEEQEMEIKKIIKDNIPEGYTYEFWNKCE